MCGRPVIFGRVAKTGSGLTIKQGPYGRGVFATRRFAAGDVIDVTGTSNPVNPCGVGPGGPYVAPPLLNFFRRSGLNTSLAQFLASQGAGQCVALASQIAATEGLGVGVPVPFGDMSPNLTTGTSNYNGLSVNLKKRLSSNYEFLVSYTWSHAIDDSTDVVSTADAPQNNFSPNAERASSTFDQRHRLVVQEIPRDGG